MSYPVCSNLQYRLSEKNGETVINFHHMALGVISEDNKKGLTSGWGYIHARVKARAEASRSR